MGYLLDIVALEKAAVAFGNALDFSAKAELKPANTRPFFEIEASRASVIHHFALCYELCLKTLNHLFDAAAGAEDRQLTRKEIFRQSQRKGILKDVARWNRYHAAWNMTSHTYNSETEREIFQAAKIFATDLHDFAKTIKAHVKG